MPSGEPDEDVERVAIDPGFKQPEQHSQRQAQSATGPNHSIARGIRKGNLPARRPSKRARPAWHQVASAALYPDATSIAQNRAGLC